MHVDRFGEGAAYRADKENPPETLYERRVQLLARAIQEGKTPQKGVAPEILWRATEIARQPRS